MLGSAERARWLRECKWGVFFHYLPDRASQVGLPDLTADDWNRQVDAFDVAGLAGQLDSVGARYCFITVGQNSGFWLAPNEAYDRIVGIRPSKCARRDLIADLSGALAARGIRLCVYGSCLAPSNDPVAVARLQWRWGFKSPWPQWGGEKTGERLAEFQRMWEEVLRDWSLRWGRRVHGWWMDGCYFADGMYRHPDPPNFESFAGALRAGNPDSILALNPGAFVPVAPASEYDDFTAGEIDLALPVAQWEGGQRVAISGRVNQAQLHVLTYLGRWWGQGPPRFDADLVAAYSRFVAGHGGVISWDVPIEPAGRVPEPFLSRLGAIGPAL